MMAYGIDRVDKQMMIWQENEASRNRRTCPANQLKNDERGSLLFRHILLVARVLYKPGNKLA